MSDPAHMNAQNDKTGEGWLGNVPSTKDFKAAAKALRWTARGMEDLPWYERWRYPVETIKIFAGRFEDIAETLSEGNPPNAAISDDATKDL